MFTSRRLGLALVAASLALLAYVVFGSSDEDKVLARIKEVARAVETRADETNVVLRTGRINGVFKDALAPDVTFTAPELGSATGVRALAVLAGDAGLRFGAITVSVGATDVHVDGALVHAVSQVTLSASQNGELRRELRTVRFELRRSGGDFRIGAIEVEPSKEAQPEARP
jgi:phosphoribosylformylglycinamidine synthase